MRVRHASHLILLIFAITLINLCYGKGSLTYVIDTTPSMNPEINQVKEVTDSISNVVFNEKSSQIENMVLVTFNDPNVDLQIVTNKRTVFKNYINKVKIVYPKVFDCPEMSMEGVLLALQESLPGSFIYVFTDASAKDYENSSQVLKQCQEKQSQIVFILTGDCHDYGERRYQVYFDIAAACSGLALYVNKGDVFSIFESIKDAIKGKQEMITSRTIPAHMTMDIPFEINEQTEYASVTASGKKVLLKVRGPSNYVNETVTWLPNVKTLRLSHLNPGKYIVTAHSSSSTTVNIFGRTDFSFEYGFSGLEAKTLKDTLLQPIANSLTHLFISVTDPDHTMNITSALILDMNENVIITIDFLQRLSSNYYKTPTFVVPSSIFKLAMYGKAVKTGKYIRRLARFPITPQQEEKVPLSHTAEGIRGMPTDIECKVVKSGSATISWEFMGDGESTFTPIAGSDITLHIPNVQKENAGRYKCTARNIAGIIEHVTTLVEQFIPYLSNKNSKRYEVREGDATLRIPCDAIGVPPPTISWLLNGVNIDKGTHYSISDGALIIKDPKMSDSGSYRCEATNKLGSGHSDFNVTVNGIPRINSKSSKIFEARDGNAELRIPCGSFGIPPPTISWTFNGNTIRTDSHYFLAGDVLVIKNTIMTDSGLYRCVATNNLGSADAVFTVEVKGVPYIKANSSETLEGQEGDPTLKILCEVIGVPAPTISWSHNGRAIIDGPHYSTTSEGLEIKLPKMSDSGTYKCKATNSLGSRDFDFDVTVKGVPYINSNTTKTFEGINGDVALKIPCEVIGIPPPVISWLINGEKITNGAHYSVSESALIIKDPKISDSGTYKFLATNNMGSASALFNVTVKEYLDDYGTIETVKINKLQNTSYKLECGLPGQSVKWFTDGIDISVIGNHLELNNFDDSYDGNYTCRVSDIQGAFTKTYRVLIGGPPTFEFKQDEVTFDWTGSKRDVLDCSVGNAEVSVLWTYNGIVINNQKSLLLDVNSRWGHYTCNVSNEYGTIQRTFDVISTRCIVPRDNKIYGAMPLILNENETWPQLGITENYFIIESGHNITFACPNYNTRQNNFKKIPTLNELTVTCDKQDRFIKNGKTYKLADIGCDHKIMPSIRFVNRQCGRGSTENIVVGYNVSSFLGTYQICFDSVNNMPQYSVLMSPFHYQSLDVKYNWYRHPAITFTTNDSVYSCENSTSNCCFSKSQLLSATDFIDGPAQNTAFIESINEIPLWRPCNVTESCWKNIGEQIGWQLELLPASALWAGTHGIQKKNGHPVPRYLFKLVEFIEADPIAIIYVNDPSPTAADILCKNICADGNVPWLQIQGDHVYCCDGEDFRETFNFHVYINV